MTDAPNPDNHFPGKPLLDFNLAPKQTMAPELIVPREGPDKLAGFLLALALAFNDLKNFEMLRFALMVKPPEKSSDPSEHTEEWGGMLTCAHRYMAGILHELLNLIRDNEALIGQADFLAIVRNLTVPAVQAWDELKTAALSQGHENTTLTRIRNKGAFHYDPKQLMNGYREAFFIAPTDDEGAAFSTGASMEETRFYFADTAVQRVLLRRSEVPSASKPLDVISNLATATNRALFEIVSANIRMRVQDV